MQLEQAHQNLLLAVKQYQQALAEIPYQERPPLLLVAGPAPTPVVISSVPSDVLGQALAAAGQSDRELHTAIVNAACRLVPKVISY